jgi:hypothetical protein
LGTDFARQFPQCHEPKMATPLAGEYNNFLPTGKTTRFAEKTLNYNISFLSFENAASAKVIFFQESGGQHQRVCWIFHCIP